MTPSEFPRHDLPPLRHQQTRALLVRKAEKHSSRRSLPGLSGRTAVPAAAVAVGLAVVAAGTGAHLLSQHSAPGAHPAAVGSPSPKQPPATNKEKVSPSPTHSVPGSVVLPPLHAFPRSISAARTRPLTAVSEEGHPVKLFSTSGSKPKLVAQFDGQSDWTASVALNPDGTLLATSSSGGTVRLWDVSNVDRPRLVQTLPHHTIYVDDLEFSADGKWLVSAGYDGNARLWRVNGDSVQAAAVLSIDSTWVSAVAFDPTGRYVAASAEDRTVLWDLQSGTPRKLATIPATDGGHISLSFSSDSHTLAIGTNDTTKSQQVALWDVTDPQAPVKGAVLPGTGPYVAFARQGDVLATANLDNVPELYRVSDAQHVTALPQPSEPGLATGDSRTLAFTADGALDYTIWTKASGVTLGQISVPAS